MSNADTLAANPSRTILLATARPELAAMLSKLCLEPNLSFRVSNTGAEVFEILLIDPPDLLIVDLSLLDMSGLELLRVVKEEKAYCQLPTMLCFASPEQLAELDWEAVRTDDFIIISDDPRVIKSRIALAMCRPFPIPESAPLTNLPGQSSIISAISQRIDDNEDFALGYCDLDHFKAYNNTHGFAQGDALLTASARLILTTVRSFNLQNSFVGHAGGDDFIFILPPEYAKLACEHITESFEAITAQFYDYKAAPHGNSSAQESPPIAMSIAVVVSKNGSLKHYGQVLQIASVLKNKAKALPGSNYLVDVHDNQGSNN